MTLRFAQLAMLWGADDARALLQLLDELRDALWETYGEEIVQLRRAERQHHQRHNTAQLDLWGFDDDDDD